MVKGASVILANYYMKNPYSSKISAQTFDNINTWISTLSYNDVVQVTNMSGGGEEAFNGFKELWSEKAEGVPIWVEIF